MTKSFYINRFSRRHARPLPHGLSTLRFSLLRRRRPYAPYLPGCLLEGKSSDRHTVSSRRGLKSSALVGSSGSLSLHTSVGESLELVREDQDPP